MFIIAYDMLTQARIALGVRFLRRHAPKSQSRGTALADYAPTSAPCRPRCSASCCRRRIASRRSSPRSAIAMAAVGACCSASPGRSAGSARRRWRRAARASRCTSTLVPAVLALATLAGVELPGAVWLLALGPIPTSVVSFAQLYGYSPRTAATGLVLSLAVAIALLPIALTIAA